MKVAVVGATGMVGQKILEVLEERNFPITELLPVASEKSKGNTINFRGQIHKIVDVNTAIRNQPQLAIFSAGAKVSLEVAPLFSQAGTIVIDNSSAWRMQKNIPLVIPEINAHILTEKDRIIANPNCSTIQMLMVLAPLHRHYGIKRVIVSTYQSVTGTGVKALEQMNAERKNQKAEKAYPYAIDKNCLPHCDVFLENNYTKEEMKLVEETHKILETKEIQISATAVRVPVIGGHSESINIELNKDFTIPEVRRILSETEGVVVQDDIANCIYPMPINAHEKDDVFVGRIRKDISCEKALNLWVVADNLRKGAATNAVQIAEYVLARNWV